VVAQKCRLFFLSAGTALVFTDFEQSAHIPLTNPAYTQAQAVIKVWPIPVIPRPCSRSNSTPTHGAHAGFYPRRNTCFTGV